MSMASARSRGLKHRRRRPVPVAGRQRASAHAFPLFQTMAFWSPAHLFTTCCNARRSPKDMIAVFTCSKCGAHAGIMHVHESSLQLPLWS